MGRNPQLVCVGSKNYPLFTVTRYGINLHAISRKLAYKNDVEAKKTQKSIKRNVLHQGLQQCLMQKSPGEILSFTIHTGN